MKLNIRKKLVSLAVASAVTGGAMMAIPAQAMNVSQNNTGEVLLFPYYTVRSGYDTILSVVNTSAKTAVFKIRWREAETSRETRDFNVILSPHDVWNGAVTQAVDGSTIFRTYDKSCTSPMLPGMTTTALRAVDGAVGEVQFANVGSNAEGYFEVILMGVADTINNTGAVATALQAGALHNAAGVPANCTAVDQLFATAGTISSLNSQLSAPENILKGSVTYINVTHGVSFNTEPTAIENFASSTIVFAPGDDLPDLASGDDISSVYFIDNGNPVTEAPVFGSENAVSALLSMGSIANEFATGTNAATSWVVTLPTKHHYTGYNKTCYDIAMSLYNREEKTTIVLDSTNFSPYDPSNPTVQLCNESTVINFNGSPIFGTAENRMGVDTLSVGTNGWVDMHFLQTGNQIDNGTSVGGLPVIGFSTIVRDSADATVNYGNAYEFAGQRRMMLLP